MGSDSPPRRITADELERYGACSDGIDRFREVFGDGDELTPANLDRAARAGLDLE